MTPWRCLPLNVSYFLRFSASLSSGHIQVQSREWLTVCRASQDLTVWRQAVFLYFIRLQPSSHRCPALPWVLPQGQRLHFRPLTPRTHAAGNYTNLMQHSPYSSWVHSPRSWSRYDFDCHFLIINLKSPWCEAMLVQMNSPPVRLLLPSHCSYMYVLFVLPPMW